MFTNNFKMASATIANQQLSMASFDVAPFDVELFEPVAIQSQAATDVPSSSVQVTVKGKRYQVSLKTGDFKALERELKNQVWWGKAALANTFAKAVGFSLGLVMIGAEAVGPLFPYDSDPGVAGTRVTAVPADLPEGYDFRVPAQAKEFTWAVATPVKAAMPLSLRISNLLKLNSSDR